MKVFKTSQIRLIDQYTIEHEPVTSIDLMERAADGLFTTYKSMFSIENAVCILAGPGNNGGDALALARKLKSAGYSVTVHLIYTTSLSVDCDINRISINRSFPEILFEHKDIFAPPVLQPETIIVDGLFGSGLTRPLSGIFSEAVKWINESACKVVAIDIPSGLNGEENNDYSFPIVVANYTFSLQFPKLAFFFSENAQFVGQWSIIDIQLHPAIIDATYTDVEYIEKKHFFNTIKRRLKFSHKGTYGHVCIIAGSKGMAGASILSAKAALRTGTGLVTIHGPGCNRIIAQTTLPEAIYNTDKHEEYISEIPHLETFSSVVIGPGIGKKQETATMLGRFLEIVDKPCVIDADALNIISENKEMLFLLPRGCIITPHPKEFERLVGHCSNSYERMVRAKEFAILHHLIVVLKGANTFIVTPENKLFINSSGNSGMATAGSGNVLSGILGSLLAQGYSAEAAAKSGVFLHGLSGDIALDTQSEESLIAEDIISTIGTAFKQLRM